MANEIINVLISNTTYRTENVDINDGLVTTVTVLDSDCVATYSARLNLDDQSERENFAHHANVPVSDLITLGARLNELAAESIDPDPKQRTGSLIVRSMASVESRDIDWRWRGWLAGDKLHLMAGVEGDGKSTVAGAIASEYSKGGRWPDGSPAPVGRVLFLSAEDGIEDILKPRLELHCADLENIMFVEAVADDKGAQRMFSLDRHLPLLERTILDYGIDLVVIDPLSSFMPSTNRNDEGEVRDLLTPLTRLAEQTHTAILGVMHLNRPNGTNRRPSQRLLGSTGFGAIARMVWIVTPVSDDPNDTRRLLAVGKTNLGMKPKPIEWSVDGDTHPVVWHGESDLNVNQLINGVSKERSLSPERESVLRYILNAGGGVRTGNVAAALDKSSATVSDHLAALAESGLIQRVAFGTYAAPKPEPTSETAETSESSRQVSELSDFRRLGSSIGNCRQCGSPPAQRLSKSGLCGHCVLDSVHSEASS